jgi:HEPN domain-containing protein
MEWLSYARDDLETAEYLLGMKPRKIEVICYHCQQCAEKALKAVLAFYEEDIPRSHDLRLLWKKSTVNERSPNLYERCS